MTSQSSLGEELVENFRLLFEYLPNEECASVVNERMLSLPDKRVFHSVMMFLLDILKPDWHSEISNRFISPKDERLFHNMLCERFKFLRKEFPQVDLPLLTPSSMICFHGQRCRENLLKITTALMLFVMRKENYYPDDDVDKGVSTEYKALSEECDSLSKKIQQKREENQKAVSHQKEVLQLVVMTGYWNEHTKRRLLDLCDKMIVSEMLKKKENSLNELKLLKEELQPYFKHVHHKYNKTECLCPPQFDLSDEKIIKISNLLCEADRNSICVDIMHLKLISTVKTLKINAAKSIDPSAELDEHVPSYLIEKLEELVSTDMDENTSVDISALLGSSPIALNMESPLGDTSCGFTPIVAHDWKKIRKTSVKMDVETFADFIVPSKVGASPVRPITSQAIVSCQFAKTKPNETIMSIVQRMRSGKKETPNKFRKQRFNSPDLKTSFTSHCTTTGEFSSYRSARERNKNAGLLLHGAMSFSKFEKFTPASKAQIPIVSHTTGRRQSMGFVKPANCLVRRQLACTPPPKTQPTASCEKPKSTAGKEDVDKILDKLVQQMVEDQNNESFGSDITIGDLDSSLSGVERIKSPCVANELELELKKDHKLCLSPTRVEQTAPLLKHSILSEVIEDEKELSVLINSMCEDKCTTTTQNLNDAEQLDIFLSDKEMSKVFDSQQKLQRKPEVARKNGRKSLDLLIARFNAIKNAQQKK